MSRIGARGTNTPSSGGPDDAPHDASGPRRDERRGSAKGPGNRDARLGTGTGREGRGPADERTGTAAESFGRSLDGALSRDAQARGEDGSGSHHGEDGRDRPDPDHPDPALAALLTGLAVPERAAASGPKPATSAGEAGIGPAGRRAALSSLWAQESDKADVARPGAAAPQDEAAASAAPAAAAPGARRLLAESGAGDGMPAAVPPFVPPAPPAAPAPAAGDGASTASGPTTGERVEKVADTVERAIRAEDTPAPGQVVSIAIPLDPREHGLGGVTVALAAAGIDVVLARGGAAASADLRAAAQALADRLQRRFPNRAVRVYDEGAAAASPDRSAAPGDAVA